MSARGQKSDPAIAAWDRLQAAEKAQSRAYDERDEAEHQARLRGYERQTARVFIGGYDCLSVAEVRRRTKGLPKRKAQEAIEVMREALAEEQQERKKAGLRPYDSAVSRTTQQWRAAMQAMADTRATTLAGVILKLKLIALELRDGKTNYGESILASAIADLARIDRK
jgi:hypothetical protein